MTAEQKLFFKVLSDHIHGQKSSFDPETIDQNVFYDFIRRQNLLGIFYIQCRDCLKPNSELYQKLYSGFCSDVFYAVNHETSYAELTVEFKKANIPFFSIKGFDLSTCYPVPRLRTMGDIDIVIHSSDNARADKILKQLGYSSKLAHTEVWAYMRDAVLFEIHNHMMNDPLANDVDYQVFFDNAWNYTECSDNQYLLKSEFYLLYLIAHTAKHILNKGYGIRGFLDLVFFTQKNSNMDWDWITEQLSELKLLAFAKICFTLCSQWFDVKMPLTPVTLSEAFISDTTQKIFQDGLWGLDNSQNDVSSPAKIARRSKLPYWITALNITREKLFPSYSIMQSIPWYSFLAGKPWLLPAAWIYRFWYCIKHKRKYGASLLATPYIKVQDVHKRESMIDSWGL